MADGIFEKGYSYTFTCLANSNNVLQTSADTINNSENYKEIKYVVNGDNDTSNFSCITNKEYTKSTNYYSITYNLNGGSIQAQASYQYGTSYTIPAPTKERNTFLGWTEGSNTSLQKTVTISTTSIGNKTYTAHWQYNPSFTLKNSTSYQNNLFTWAPNALNATSIVFTSENKCTSSYSDLSDIGDGSVRGCLIGSTFYIAPGENGHKIYANKSMSHFFDSSGNSSNKTITFANLDTSSTTNMSGMFQSQSFIENIYGLEILDTSNVTDMNYMFAFLFSIKSINLSKINTSKVTNMAGMFNGFANGGTVISTGGQEYNNVSGTQALGTIKNLSLTNFNTGNVTNMSMMFANMYIVESIDISSFNTPKVTTMAGMFEYTRWGLTKVYYGSGWNTSSVSNKKELQVGNYEIYIWHYSKCATNSGNTSSCFVKK